VLTVRHRAEAPAEEHGRMKRLLCPVNYSDVAHDAIVVSGAMAEAFDGEIYVVNVVESGRNEPHEGDLDALRTWIPHAIRHRCLYKELVIRGNAAETIIDLAQKLETDMIVVGAQHRRFVDTTVIGTTTERILRYAHCPVMTVVRKVEAAEKGTPVDERVTTA
jgi:nucleotide-binding universal stress UspA family protein